MENHHETDEFGRAWRIVENTSANLFLTGKAGTGKTTFLRQFVAESHKRLVVLAPTGIAAVNAGGVTVHSFFQFPFAPYVPGMRYSTETFRKSRHKLRLIRSLDLIVIDEISMVRADLLDHIDESLRRLRGSSRPFGGVQLLMIGDLQQLAPVVKDDEWELLRPYYGTPFFFSSRALSEAGFVTVELQRIYRQTDAEFVEILNRIRENRADAAVLDTLNRRHIAGFEPSDDEGYIRLVTHNAQARSINSRKLEALPGPGFRFDAAVEGNFPPSSYPAEETLELREGAQVMFVKNDPDHRWYNGSLGRVEQLCDTGFSVRLTGGETVEVEPVEWTSQKYALNTKTREIEAKTDGLFRQFPVRTAWAITIHKSQGLTFDRAIVDAHAAFSHGQTYVALSRCRTLDGLVLSTPVPPAAIIADSQVVRFSEEAAEQSPDVAAIEHMERDYVLQLLDELFGFGQVRTAFDAFMRLLEEHFYKLYPRTLDDFRLRRKAFGAKVLDVAARFHMQYAGLLGTAGLRLDSCKLQERLRKGAAYFTDELTDLFVAVGRTDLPTDNTDLTGRTDEALDAFGEALATALRLLHHVAKAGFDRTEYARRRALEKAGMNSEKSADRGRKPGARSATAPGGRKGRGKEEVPQDILHPELFDRLAKWRKNEAVARQVPAYVVMPQRALLGIANLLPRTLEALARIPYVGARRAENYGQELLALVQEFDG